MNPLPAHRSGPRLWLVATLALTGSLYLLYLLSTIGLMLAMRHQPHALSMTASHELPQSDFAIFWSAGKLLAMRSAARFGLHLPLSAWYRQTFPLDLLSAGAPFTLAWPYPPPMGLLVMPFSFIPLAVQLLGLADILAGRRYPAAAPRRPGLVPHPGRPAQPGRPARPAGRPERHPHRRNPGGRAPAHRPRLRAPAPASAAASPAC